jgi:hypothetical protein
MQQDGDSSRDLSHQYQLPPSPELVACQERGHRVTKFMLMDFLIFKTSYQI